MSSYDVSSRKEIARRKAERETQRRRDEDIRIRRAGRDATETARLAEISALLRADTEHLRPARKPT